MTTQCDKVDKREFQEIMTENNEIAANMNFHVEKNQEQKSALIMKISNEISDSNNYSIESPMSNLAFRLGISKIATPKLHKSPEMCETNINEDKTALNNNDKIIDNKDLISQIVTSVENSPITRNPSRRPLISPQNINFDLQSDLHNDEDDDMSFYPLNRPFYGVKLNGENISSDEQSKIRDQITAPLLTLVEPNSPKKSSPSESADRTPSKYTITSTGSSRLGNGFKLYDSISSGSNESNEMEDEYLELMEMENLDEETQMPSDMCSLLCKDVKNLKSPGSKKTNSTQKCTDMDKSTENDMFKMIRTSSLFPAPDRQCLATINENVSSFGSNRGTPVSFKRPEPPTVNPTQSKRHKGEQDEDLISSIVPLQVKRPTLRKTVSMNDAASIMDALSRSSDDKDLIGDFSKKFCLPFIDGRHKDLRSISADTMRSLLLGGFDDCVSSYKIIDCRYPYEYEGGHIKGAINLYTQDQIIEELVNKKSQEVTNIDGENRNILIFHCEFSSERGPKLSRFLRNHDRMSSPYPTLQYPEIYLLHGGYKEFFQSNSDLCEPHLYRPMLDTSYSNEYKHFRAKSKSWTGDGRSSNRLSKSRSRLVL
ncbi:M-phase inducer phosphatase-like [Chironomus tepperi]|uniref:M-phase inducer phosphatase-like n=1 Tax=Chironomus tepperi TaxID=113505 RepID=UPI00391FC967